MNRKKLTIQDMQRIANGKGGKCLSKEYVNIRTKLEWECKEGHVWMAVPSSITKTKASWCPHCAKSAKLTIQDMQQIAQKRGGKCLSEKYINAHTKLEWECKEGHVWKTTPSSIKQGSWCSYCIGRKMTIKNMQQIAQEKGGKCLSKLYVVYAKLEWECKEGHVWWATPASIKQGSWCRICAIEKQRKTKMQKTTNK